MSMPALTRTVGFLLVLLGVISYIATGAASITALIPAMVGAIFLILAMVARNPGARRHVMHAAVALALISVIAMAPRVARALGAGDLARPAVLAQIAMLLLLLGYVVMGVRSFVIARRARG